MNILIEEETNRTYSATCEDCHVDVADQSWPLLLIWLNEHRRERHPVLRSA